MKDGFIKIAAATPALYLADPSANAKELIRLAKEAAKKNIQLLVFPELSLTGCTCGDLFFSETLIRASRTALAEFLEKTEKLNLIALVGLPVETCGKLYDCAAVCCKGQVLGFVPKTNLGRDARWFASAPNEVSYPLDLDETPFGSSQIFCSEELKNFKFAVEIGTDMDLTVSPATEHAMAGATVLCNLANGEEYVGTEESRLASVLAESKKTLSAYILASSGCGESTTDTVSAGHALICEEGELLAERKPFTVKNDLTVTEIDVDKLQAERRCSTSFRQISDEEYSLTYFTHPVAETALTRHIPASPFIPENEETAKAQCKRILEIQAYGLATRVQKAHSDKVVVGISGGLDSTLALLVMNRAMELLNRPKTDIIAVTMPGFGTTKRTRDNATILCEELGVDFRCIPMGDSVNKHFADIGHNPADRNTTYENAQARERTQILMDLANDCNGLVVGTGDLSELALGWATYNGDHMSMYAVNGTVPKTLIRKVVATVADEFFAKGEKKIAAALRDILNTPVSPELLPADGDGKIAQKTEDLVGPYEIHDFYLYYFLRYGFAPQKLFRLAKVALGNTYDDETLQKWLNTFLRRFFSQQFKRSCMPDGPKTGIIDLSPRGEWSMPSDACATEWLK